MVELLALWSPWSKAGVNLGHKVWVGIICIFTSGIIVIGSIIVVSRAIVIVVGGSIIIVERYRIIIRYGSIIVGIIASGMGIHFKTMRLRDSRDAKILGAANLNTSSCLVWLVVNNVHVFIQAG